MILTDVFRLWNFSLKSQKNNVTNFVFIMHMMTKIQQHK